MQDFLSNRSPGPEKSQVNLDEIQILIINMTGIYIGIDTDSIKKITTPDEVDQMGIAPFPLYEKMDFHLREARYTCPQILLFCQDPERMAGVIIEKPEDIVTIRTELINPLPSFIRTYSKPPAIWGVLNSEDRVILLMDLYKLTL